MKTTLKLGLLGIAVLSITACDGLDPTSNRGEFYYSNPTSSNISFKVDGKDYEILPGHNDIIKLSSGVHKLENSQGDTFSFMVFDNNNGGILNPDNHVYYTVSEAYAVEGKGARFKPITYNVTINGHEIEMAVRSANASVIDGNLFKCSYQLGEPFPETVVINDRNSDGNIASKCFDKTELVQYISKEYGENLAPVSTGDETKDSINMTFSYDLPAANFTNPEVQAKAEEVLALLKQFKDTNDTDLQEKLEKKFHKLSIDLVTVHTKDAATTPVLQNEAYNDFVNRTSDLRTYGIWVR